MAELFIARLPALSHVEAFEAELQVARDSRRGPFLQLLKSKCRELARSESSLLLSPTTASLHTSFGALPPMTLWIIAKMGYINNPKLQEKLKHHGMKVLRRVSVSESVLQTCYQFSLTARLAPKWNLLTSWLVQGLEFLTTGRAHAIVLHVGVTKTEMTLSVNVSKLTFNFLQPSDLDVSTSTLSAFTSDSHFVIRENSIYNNRCVLIPNLTVGYVFSACHQLPSSPEFPTYDTVRLHWKKQHGMILPEKQSLFFQVFFKSSSNTFFSYPGCCVLRSPPTVSSTRDSRAVANSFIADVHARMPTLCGDTIRYSNKALTPFAHLQTATQPSTYPNVRPAVIPSRPASMPRPGPMSGGTQFSGGQRQSTSLSLIRRVSSAVAPRGTAHHPQMQTVPSVNSSLPPSSARTFTTADNLSCPGNGLPSTYSHPSPLAPSSSQGRRDTSSVPNRAAEMNTRIVPVFKPAGRSSGTQPSKSVRPAATVPSFKPTARHLNAQTVPRSATKKQQGSTAATLHQQSHLGKKHAWSEPSLQPPTKQPRVNALANSGTASTGSGATGSRGGENNKRLVSMGISSSSAQMVPDLSRRSEPGTDRYSSEVDLHSTAVPGNPSGSSTGGCGAGPTTQKKGKGGKKMTIQVEGVSEETVTRISRVKAPLLRKWLQENRVKCTSKKTKDDMIRMAAEYIRDTGTTFTAAPS